MLDIYLYVIFILVVTLIYGGRCFREHLTLEEVSAESKKLDTKVKKLENEYKELHNTVETQEKRMGGAASEAAGKLATLHS